MAMNKQERAAMEALRVKAALGWPQFERPEPVSTVEIEMFLKSGNKWFRGWWVNEHVPEVGEGGTDGHFHARTAYTDEQIANRHRGGASLSQTAGGPWFRDKEDALRELHWRLAEKCAATLAAISALTMPDGTKGT